MKKRILLIAALASVLASVAAVSSALAAQPNTTAHLWTGVWQVRQTGKPGVTITLADDSGTLAGTIVFDVFNRETNQRIAIEPRTIVNPHLDGNALAFQVRRILKPHLKDAPVSDESQPDPTDIVDMTLIPTSGGKATLNCPKCGEAAPTEVVKAE